MPTEDWKRAFFSAMAGTAGSAFGHDQIVKKAAAIADAAMLEIKQWTDAENAKSTVDLAAEHGKLPRGEPPPFDMERA